MDSPGTCNSAQYCTYTAMEKETKKIISVKTLDKRKTEGKNVNLEKAGLARCLEEIQDKGLNVSEIVTDAHLQIDAMMSKHFLVDTFYILHVCMHLHNSTTGNIF